MPVRAPDESALALARGAALAAANAPAFDATTAGLAYSQDPDVPAGADFLALASADTVLRPAGASAAVPDDLSEIDDIYDDADYAPPAEEGRKPFLLVGSALTSIFVVGVVALAISLAVSIRPTVDQRPEPARGPIVPEAAAPAAPPVLDVPEAQLPAPAPAPAPAPPPAETIKPPIPVVQQQPAPRQVYVEAPAPQAPPPEAPAPVPPPAAPVPAPVPVVVPPVPQVIPAPAPYVPQWRPPVYNPPAYNPPLYNPPNQNPWPQRPPWQNPWPQRPPRGNDDWPGGGPQFPQQPPVPQLPPQAPQQPWPQQGNQGGYDGGGQGGQGGYGGGRGGDGGHGGQGGQGGGPKICFLTFCSG